MFKAAIAFAFIAASVLQSGVFAQDVSSCISSSSGQSLADCAFGYGVSAKGGKGGANYVVTSDADSGSGSLRDLLASFKKVSGGKWITFTQGKTFVLNLTAAIDIKEDSGCSYITIDGRGADVTLKNYGFNVFKTNNVIIHNVKIRDALAKQDLMQISEASDVWIDHVSFSNPKWGSWYPSEGSYPDGACDISNGATRITVSYSSFNHHNKTMLLGNSDNKPEDKNMNVTIAFNYFGSSLGQRLPRMRYGKFDITNNFYDGPNQLLIGGSSDPAALIRNNVFKTTAKVFYEPTDEADTNKVSFFVSGNSFLGGAIDNSASITKGTQTKPVPDYTWTPVAAASVTSIVSSKAGAK